MVVTESGMVTEVSPVLLKALSPMEVTEFGMVITEVPWSAINAAAPTESRTDASDSIMVKKIKNKVSIVIMEVVKDLLAFISLFLVVMFIIIASSYFNTVIFLIETLSLVFKW